MNNTKNKKLMPAIIISLVCMVVIVILDQVSKYLIVSAFGMEQYIGNMELEKLDAITRGLSSVELIPGVLNFTFVLNDGAAFGSLDNARWIFMVLSTVAIIAILVYLIWKKPQNKLLLLSLTLITGGGIANMIDRVRFGYVIDFIDFCAFPQIWKWIFNVADSCVTIGAALLALWMIIDLIKEAKSSKAKKISVDVELPVCDGEVGDGNEEVALDSSEDVARLEAETAENGEANDGNNE